MLTLGKERMIRFWILWVEEKKVDNSTLCLDDEYIGVNTVKNRLIVERNLIQLV